MNLDTLLSYHKQETSEELTYLTIIFTAVLGILGYLGSATKIEPQVRIAIVIIFSIFMGTFVSALVGSLHIHNALHEEIKNFATLHPEIFIGNEKSKLFIVLSENLKPHNITLIICMGIGLSLMVNIGLLTLGEGRVFSFPKIVKSKKNRTFK